MIWHHQLLRISNKLYPNLVINGSFENDLNGWSTITTLPDAVTTKPYYGTKSIYKSIVGNSDYRCHQDITVPVGHKIYFACKVFRTSVAGTASIMCRCSDYGSSANQLNLIAVNTNQWEPQSNIFTVNAGTSGIRIQCIYSAATVSDSVAGYIDGIIAVDLTALGLDGMTKAWCDANIVPPSIVF